MRHNCRQWCAVAAVLGWIGWSVQLQAEEGGQAPEQTDFAMQSSSGSAATPAQPTGPTARSALPPRPAGSSVQGAQFEAGRYRGVVPGHGNPPPRARRLGKTRRNMVTWPGFEQSSAGSRFFVQSTRPITFGRADQPTQVVVVLQNTRIHLRNNRNPLVTAHFSTPVAGARLRRRGRHTHLILDMKVEAQPRIRQTSQGDFHFLFVEFAPGDYPVPEPVAPAQAQDPSQQSYRLSEPPVPGADSYNNPGDPTL